jgi:hypothetical protein
MTRKQDEEARKNAILALQNGTTLEEVASTLFEHANTTPNEIAYGRGHRQALVSMLAHVLRELGYQDTEATRAKWIIEREETVNALRAICHDHGDNDWPPDLSLADVIDKHLHRHLG